jgi:nucleoside-diphosphate kinase
MVDADKYNFQCEFYDEASQMTKEYLLTLYAKPPPSPNELSLYDVKAKRVFLKKGVYDQDGPINLEDLYLNGTVTICSRKFKITGHADAATRSHFESHGSLCQVTIGAEALGNAGQLLHAAHDSGVAIKRIRSFRDPQRGASAALTVEFVGPSVMEVMDKVVRQLGMSGLVQVLPSAPMTDKIFGSPETTARHDNCSVCIIRPHAVREGNTGFVFNALAQAGFEISAVQSYSLTRPQAENFYEVYKTVLPSAHYMAMISEIASGVCIVLEVRAGGEPVQQLRELCGPYDVEIAKHLRPGTLRASLGRDNVHNAVHCTDLPEDGILESQYFFSILPAAGACH